MPAGEERAEKVNTILRFDSASDINTRWLVFDLGSEDIYYPQSTWLGYQRNDQRSR